jgi:hypothetical protein
MEGFLTKKGRGDSGVFGRRNWKKRWCVLEGSYLTYYEDFDPKTNTLGAKKVYIDHYFFLCFLTRVVRYVQGVCVVKGCEISVVSHPEKKFSFAIKHSERKPMFLSADTEKMMFGKNF